MKKIFSFAVIALITFNVAFAQESGNWFVGAGAGVNTIVAPHTEFNIGGLSADLFAGKWITPSSGFRFGYKGIKNSFKVEDGYKTNVGNGTGDFKQQHFIHADFLVNLSNLWGDSDEYRFWNVIPYVGAGMMTFNYTNTAGNGVNDHEWALNAGILNNFRLNRMSIYIDLNASSFRREVLCIQKSNDRFAYSRPSLQV